MLFSFEAKPRPGRRRQRRDPAGVSPDASLALRELTANCDDGGRKWLDGRFSPSSFHDTPCLRPSERSAAGWEAAVFKPSFLVSAAALAADFGVDPGDVGCSIRTGSAPPRQACSGRVRTTSRGSGSGSVGRT
jgi:hypothetical protein